MIMQKVMALGTTVAVVLLLAGTPVPLQLAAVHVALHVATSAAWMATRVAHAGFKHALNYFIPA